MTSRFEVIDCRGYKIVCSDENWCDKILGSRPWMNGWEELVKKALSTPAFICKDRDHPNNREVYYLFHDYPYNRYIKVIVRFSTNHLGNVISAFPTDSAKEGEDVIWMPSRN